MLTLPRRVVHKPAEGVGVNWSDPITQRLIRLWAMNEGGGTKTLDLVGNIPLVGQGAGMGWGSGPRGAALTFSGAASTFAVDARVYPSAVTAPYTVALWFKLATSGSDALVSCRQGADHSFDIQTSTTTGFHADIGDGTNWLTTAANLTYAITLGAWYHVAYVVTATGYTIYASSPAKATRATTTGSFSGTPLLFDGSRHVQIGQGGNGSNNNIFTGAIDSLMIWQRALGADEVLRLSDPADLGFLQPLAPPSRFWFFQQFKGTASVAPPKGTLAASGAEKLGGTGSEAPPKPTLAALAAETVAAAGGLALPTSALALVASESFGATVAEAPPAAVLAASSTETFATTGAVSLGASIDGSGTQQIDGAGSLAGESTLAAAGSERLAAVGAVAPPVSLLVGHGAEKLAGSAAIAPPASAIAATGDSTSGGAATGAGGIVGPGPTLSGQGTSTPAHHGASGGRGTWRVGVAAAPLTTIVGAAKVVAPTPLVAGEGHATPVVRGSGAVVLAAGRVVGHAAQRQRVDGHGVIASPLPTIGASGDVEVACVGAVTVTAVIAGRGLPLIEATAHVLAPSGRIDARGRARRPLWRQIEDDVLLGLLPEEEMLRVA